MNQDSQLGSLRKTLELEERKALQHYQDVERVVAERRKITSEAAKRVDALRKRIDDLDRVGRVRALRKGNIVYVHGATSFLRRLRKELAEAQTEHDAREKELQQAVERAKLAEEELSAARLERRRVEKLVEDRSERARIVGAAIEEVLNEEMTNFKTGR